MGTARFQPREAEQTDLKKSLEIGLDEAFTALAESFRDLTDDLFWAFPLEHRHNIVTLVEHCLQCLDLYGCEVHGHSLTFEPEERFDIWHYSADQLRPRMTDLPSVADERDRLSAVRRAVMGVLDQTSGEELGKPNMSSWWFEEQPSKVRADAFMRAICHTMAHVRQVWLLRGLMGLTDAAGWPEQHWA